jgi:hypothetical protein
MPTASEHGCSTWNPPPMQPRHGQTGSAGLARNSRERPECLASGPQNGRAEFLRAPRTRGAFHRHDCVTALLLPIKQRRTVWLALSQAAPAQGWHAGRHKRAIPRASAVLRGIVRNQGQTFSPLNRRGRDAADALQQGGQNGARCKAGGVAALRQQAAWRHRCASAIGWRQQ